MANLSDTYNSVQKALCTLDEVLKELAVVTVTANPKLEQIICDAVIKRFEFSYDLFWKLLKKYLEFKYALEKVNSPKAVFREIVSRGVCSEAEGRLLIEMVDSRNITAHEYDQESAEAVCANVSAYYDCMLKITERIKIDLANS